MATVASLVANPIVLRNPQPKFSAAKLSTTFNRRRHASCAPKFKVDVKRFLSAAKKNQYLTTTTTDSQKSGRHGSVCNAIKDHLVFGKPLGRGSVEPGRPLIRTTLRTLTTVLGLLHYYTCYYPLFGHYPCAVKFGGQCILRPSS
jgi:hypothetical protein